MSKNNVRKAFFILISVLVVTTVLPTVFCACSGEYLEENNTTNAEQKTEPVSANKTETGLDKDDEPIAELLILKTGKSDCIMIFIKDKTVLIDTADDDDYVDISQALKLRGIEKIDFLILTHFDKDHIGSAVSIMNNYKVSMLYMPDYVKDGDEYRSLFDYLALSDVPKESLHDEEKIFQIGEAKFTVNATSLYEAASTDSESNNCSLIVTLECGEMKLLFTGDAEKERLVEFLSSGAGHYDFIKLPYHGDCNKPLKTLISDAQAKYAVICAASSFTVESELISRLASAETKCFMTYDGDVHIVCGRKSIYAYQD